MSESPYWSTTVPTNRRERVLCETIRNLLKLSYPNYELLVIDHTQDHDTATEQFYRDCQDRHPDRCRWHYVAKANLPHARIVGANLAKGSYLLYCDGNNIPPKNLTKLHLENLQRPGSGASTGAYM